MLTLAIETSGRAGSIALSRDGTLSAEVQLAATGRRHARTLVPEISELLSENHLAPKDIELLAVSIGPGSFTGLRVGVVCAKTFAYAIGCPIVGVDTFQSIAAAQSTSPHLWVIEDALRGDVCAGEYRLKDGAWQTVSPPRLIPFDQFREDLPPEVPVSGPGVDQWQQELAAANIPVIEPAPLRSAQARWIASIGEQMALDNQLSDLWRLEPFYMRRSAAEEKADAASG